MQLSLKCVLGQKIKACVKRIIAAKFLQLIGPNKCQDLRKINENRRMPQIIVYIHLLSTSECIICELKILFLLIYQYHIVGV